MSLIALEEHVMPAELAGQIWTDEYPQAVVGSAAIREALADVEGKRLPAMDAAGIDIQVLSGVAPAGQGVGAAETVALTRAINERLAAITHDHPDRFRALASVPTPDPVSAPDEARRAIEEYGMVGFMLNGHTGGRFLDAPEFDPLLATIEDLGVPIYLHPTFPPRQVAEVYYGGLDPMVGGMLATAAWGWHAETGLHVLRLAVTGVFDRYPGLQVVVGHMGENLPFSLMRADWMISSRNPGIRSVAEVIREHVSITICGYTTVPPLQCALSVFGADRLMFSVDYPFSDPSEHAHFLAEAPIAPADRAKIAHKNAERLFKL